MSSLGFKHVLENKANERSEYEETYNQLKLQLPDSLKEESLNLRKVDESKELSKVKLDSTSISFETLEDEQDGLSSQLNYEKIEELELKKRKYEGLILINKYDNLVSAKLETNKIKNLGLFFEDMDEKIAVFSGPFKNNDINLKLDFLTRNGYLDAKIYP